MAAQYAHLLAPDIVEAILDGRQLDTSKNPCASSALMIH
jgi:hypothetical protein